MIVDEPRSCVASKKLKSSLMMSLWVSRVTQSSRALLQGACAPE